jgi:hypothetical protein
MRVRSQETQPATTTITTLLQNVLGVTEKITSPIATQGLPQSFRRSPLP